MSRRSPRSRPFPCRCLGNPSGEQFKASSASASRRECRCRAARAARSFTRLCSPAWLRSCLPAAAVGRRCLFRFRGRSVRRRRRTGISFRIRFQGRCRRRELQADWALSRADEKAAFERFVDFVIARLEIHPDLHIYHYAPYEPAALKRLMGRYATRERRDRPNAPGGPVCRSVCGRAARDPCQRRELLDQEAGALVRHSSALSDCRMPRRF